MGRTTCLSSLCALAVISAAPVVYGQDASTGAAIALFDEGTRLLAEGKYGEACPKLERSQQLAPSGGTLFALADCYEKNGQIASGWVAYREAALRARAARKSEAEQRALVGARRLEPLVSYVTVEPTKSISGLVVTRDGQPIAQAEWGVPLPFDPGNHFIGAEAPGRRQWSTKITIPTTSERRVVSIPDLESEASPGQASEKPNPNPNPNPPPPEDPGSSQRVIGYGVAALGIVGVGVGTIFGLRTISKNDEAAKHCRTEVLCDPEGLALHDQARSAATVSTIAFIAGGVALIGGVVLVMTAPTRPSTSLREIRIRVAPNGVGASATF